MQNKNQVDYIKKFFPNAYVVIEENELKTVEIVDDELDNIKCIIESDTIQLNTKDYQHIYLNKENLIFLLKLLD